MAVIATEEEKQGGEVGQKTAPMTVQTGKFLSDKIAILLDFVFYFLSPLPRVSIAPSPFILPAAPAF